MSRNDLNTYHLIARGGLSPLENGDLSLLLAKNKNGWLPVHLAKNKTIAKWLYEQSLQIGILQEDIINLALINNAQSIQTKYDQDLLKFFIERDFSNLEATKAATPPTSQSRIELSLFWLDLIEEQTLKKKFNIEVIEQNSFYLALGYSNSYFFFALIELLKYKPYYTEFFISLLKNYPQEIGSIYYVKDRAFQLQQLIKQNFNILLPISKTTVNGSNLMNKNAIDNLEGF